MNTNFYIIWFEDNDEWYEGMKEDIEEYIKDRCFNPIFYRYKSLPLEDNDLLSNGGCDLILADLNLDQGQKGNDAIKAVRDIHKLSDALFYSTDGIDKIKSVMKNDLLEGTYLSLRDDILFPKKVKSLIDKSIQRSEDIINVRGLLMDSVSEFDEKLKDIIKKYQSLATQEEQDELNDYSIKKVFSQIEENKTKINKIKDNFITSALNNTYLLDSFKLSQIVNNIFKTKYPVYDKMKSFHNNYNSSILSERNKLAHAKKEPETDGAFYFVDPKSGEKTVYNSQKCRRIRREIIFYNQLLDEAIDVIV